MEKCSRIKNKTESKLKNFILLINMLFKLIK